MQLTSKLEQPSVHKLGKQSYQTLKLPQSIPSLSKPFLNKLIHAAGHDLRSPLFVIRAYSQLLQRTQEKDRLKRGFHLISDATQTMEGIINSMVQLMDIYTLPLPQKEALFFDENLEHAKFQLCNEIEAAQPTFVVDFKDCSEVDFSAFYLKEIMVLLIDNAIRHNTETKNLAIHIKTYKKNNSPVLEIVDNGKGIEKIEELDKIKQPFYSASEDEQCIGIGLSKIEAIAQVAKSKFEIISKPNKGMTCRFYF